MKKNKTLITIVVVALLVAALVVGLLIFRASKKESVSDSLSLGNHYLTSLDYNGAIEQYNRVLAIDPYNQAALQGIAVSYAGNGNIEMSRQIMTDDMVQATEPEILRVYADILEDAEEYLDAARILEVVVDARDTDEDYANYQEVLLKALTRVFDRQYPYAESNNVSIDLNQGTVRTRGTNVLGALGTGANLGEYADTEAFSSADFPGAAESVFTTGTQSVVIDENGHLWSAGSNRSGQKANRTATLVPEEGWTEDTELGTVVKAAGTGSSVFALTAEGDLYVAGQNNGYVFGSSWLNTWTPVAAFGKVMDVQYDGANGIYVLAVSGRLYRAEVNQSSGTTYVSTTNWRSVDKDIVAFSSSGQALVAIDRDGQVRGGDGYEVEYPETWQTYDEQGQWTGNRPAFKAVQTAALEDGAYFLDDEGKVHFVKDGTASELALSQEAVSLYTSGSSCVVQMADGSYQLYDSDGKEKA